MAGKARTILWTTVVVGALLVALAAVGPALIPAATYQRAIERELAARLDAHVSIGRFRFRLLPTPGYTIRNFALISTAAPFQGMPLLEVGELNGTLSFGALLRGRLETAIDARNATLEIRMAEGSSNVARMFRIAGTRAGTEGMAPGAAPARAPAAGAPAPQGFRAMPAPTTPPAATPAAPRPAPAAPPPTTVLPPAPTSRREAGRGPRVGALAGLLESTADAAEVASEADALAPRALSIESVRAVRSRVRLHPEGDAPPLDLQSVELDARRRTAASGWAADVRLAGLAAGEAGGPVSAQGRVAFDDARRELSLAQVKASFRGAPFALDATVNFGLSPLSIDLHLASPALTRQALEPLLPWLDATMPLGLSWEGSVAADLTFRGTRESGEAGLQLDASGARVFAGSLMVKEAGFPCKFTARAALSGTRWSIDQGALAFEGEQVAVTGEVGRDAALTAKLQLSGEDVPLATLRILAPPLAFLGIPDRMAISIAAAGALAGGAPLALEGQFRAARFESGGYVLEELSGSFVREGDALSFPAVRATLAGGTLSGNGMLLLGVAPSVTVDAVIDRANVASFTTLRGGIAGAGSLAIKAQASGGDAASLAERLTLSGSMILPEGTITCGEPACGALAEATWSAITEISTALPDEAMKQQLLAAGSTVKDLKAEFTLAEETLSLTDLTWTQPLYAARVRATAAPDGVLTGEGTIAIAAATAAALYSDPAVQRALFETDGTLLLPVQVAGTVAAPVLRLDKERLTSLVVARQAAAAPPPAPAKGAKATKEKSAPQGPSAVTPPAPAVATSPAEAPAAPTPPAPTQAPSAAAPAGPEAPAPAPAKKAPAKKARGTRLPLQDPDDVLKVIIGR